MRKFLKIMGYIFLAAILLMFAATFVISKLANTNDYKTKIEQFALKKTHRQVIISGPISVTFFPWLSVHLSQVSMKNADNQTNLINVGDMRIKIRVPALLTGKFEVKDFYIANANLDVVVDANGHSNLPFKKKTTPSDPRENPAKGFYKTVFFFKSLHINQFHIKNLNVHFVNQQTGKKTDFTNINFDISNFNLNEKFPIHAAFDYQENDSSNKLHAELNTSAEFNLISLNVAFSPLKITTNLSRTHLPTITADLSGTLTYDCGFYRWTLSDGIMNLANLKVNTKLIVNVLKSTPTIQISLNTADASLAPLAENLWNKKYIEGKLNFSAKLETLGSTPQQILNNLNGSGQFRILDGTIKGANVEDLLAKAVALIEQKQPASSEIADQTRFKMLGANFAVKQGILSSHDLELIGNQITVKGVGQADLEHLTINSELQAQYANAYNGKPFTLPILISGALNHPSIRPNYDAIAKNVITNQVQDYIVKAAKKNLGVDLKTLLH